MRMRHWGVGTLLFLLVGCGGYAPLHRAHDIVFDVPYITHEKKHDELVLGAKQLSVPEVQELFCRSEKLIDTYSVYYLRAHNTGDKSYFLHILDAQLPTRKDIESFFDPHSAVSTIAHIIMMVPIGVGIAALTNGDAMISFLSFLGISMGSHLAENFVLGVAGYDKLAKYAVVTDPDRGTPGLAVLPYRHEHYLLFIPRQHPSAGHLKLSVAAKDAVTKEVTFDLQSSTLS